MTNTSFCHILKVRGPFRIRLRTGSCPSLLLVSVNGFGEWLRYIPPLDKYIFTAFHFINIIHLFGTVQTIIQFIVIMSSSTAKLNLICEPTLKGPVICSFGVVCARVFLCAGTCFMRVYMCIYMWVFCFCGCAYGSGPTLMLVSVFIFVRGYVFYTCLHVWLFCFCGCAYGSGPTLMLVSVFIFVKSIQGPYCFWKVMEIENAIFQDLENFGKDWVFI